MAAARGRGWLSPLSLCLALLLCAPPTPPPCWASRELDRRFAEYKRCADPECSMLMCRGKAVKDFKGPDCRFVDFKEGESVYVYYKLSGRTNDLWAGSVGSNFGYFPKDLLEINHIYTHNELELPTDETDFICFEDGKDDFENYNADELILSEDIVNSDMEDDLETEKEEGVEKADPTESIDPESDGLEVDVEESNEDHAEMSEEDNFIFEKNKNVAGSLDSKSENHALNSSMDNPQGEQNAHQPSEDMLQEMLKVPEHESAKNVTLSQGESKQSDYGSRNDSAYKPLHQELSEDLKTTFGSTADAVVSDDETTSLITPLDGDAGQDLDIDSYDVENLEEALKESDEIPLLSFTEDIKSSDDPESENMSSDDIFESETSDPDYDTRKATTKHINEKKDDSDLLTHIGDKIFAIVSGGERITDEDTDDLEEEEEEEEDNNELAVISKEKDEDVSAHSVTSSEDVPLISEHELIAKRVHNVDISDAKEEKTQEKGNSKSGVEATIEKPQSKSMTIGAFSNYGDGLQSKESIETKEETVKPPLGDIKDDPEGLSFHKTIKDREGMKHLEDNLENDTEHKIVLDKLGQTEDEKENSVNIVSELLEEQINQSQSDDSVLEGKTEYDTKQDDKDFELKMVLSEKQVNVSAMENVAVEEHIEEAIKDSKQEKETQHLEEEDDNDENDLTSSKEIPEKRSAVENSMRATQHGNFPQQNIAPKEAEQSLTDGDMVGEELPKTEPQFLELDAEEDNFLEEELLQDENALSAKMSKEGLAAEQSFTSGIESASPQLQMPNDAISRAANPADSGKEAITTLEQAKTEDSVQDLNKENEGMQINEDSQLNEVKKRKDKEEKLLVVDEKHKNLDLYDKMTSSSLNISELEDKKDDLNETERHLQENFLQQGFKDKQVTAEDNPLHNPSGPIGDSEHTNEATEPEYSQSVRQLTIMNEYLDVKHVERLKKYLGEQHTFRIESLFHDMEQELMVAQKHDNPEETEKALDEILETSESNVLDIVNHVLDSREIENKEEVIREMDLFDEEAAIMDDIQEVMYSLRQKYSPISESSPLVSLPQSEMDSGASFPANAKQTEHDIHVVENTEESTDQKLPGDTEQMSQEDAVLQFDPAEKADHLDQPEEDGNILTETVTLDEMEDTKVLDGDKTLPHVDIVLGSDDLGRTIEKDMTPDLNGAKNDTVEDSGDPSEADPDASHSIASWDASVFSAKDIMQHFTENIVSTLPEEIRPGPDFHGLPWEPIMITVLVGFATLFFMFCRICLPIKKRIYQVSEKQMAEKINTLLKDKANILEKLAENEQKVKDTNDSLEKSQKYHGDISDSISVLKETSENILQKNRVLSDRMERVKNIIQMENEKRDKNKNQFTEIQTSLDTFQETLTLLSKKQYELQRTLSEFKLNEENMKSELHNVLEKNAVLQKNKEQLLQEMEGWRERDAEQRAQLNFYQKYHRDLEEVFAYKENESEAMTKCIVDLKDLDTDFETGKNRDEGNDLPSGQSPEIKKEKMKDQIVKMMDTSKVKATFSACEQEMIYLQAKLKEEVTTRHSLEEKMKNLELESSSLRASKIQTDNELKMLHQKLEVLNEHFQKKEMLLEKKLAQEEYEVQEQQQKLSAAAEKSDLASKEVKLYKQKIVEMEEEFKKTERCYKEEIAANEKKAHENWLLSRALERTLAAERKDASNLRHQLINVNKQLEIIQNPLVRNLTSYRRDHHGLPRGGPLSQDGSFGPSPVGGEAPSSDSQGSRMTGFPGQPLPANLMEGLRDLGPSPAPLMDHRPKISSPFVQEGMENILQNPPKDHEDPCLSRPTDTTANTTAVNTGLTGPPSFSRIPMTYQALGPMPASFLHQTAYGAQPLPRPIVGDGPPPPNPRHYPQHPSYPTDYPPGPWPPYSRDYTPRPRPPFPRDYPPGPWPIFPNDYPQPFLRDYPPHPPFGMQDVPPRPLPPPEQRGYLCGAPLPFWPPPSRDYDPGFSLPQQGVRDFPPPPVQDLPPAGPNNNQGNCATPPSLPTQGVSAYPPPPAEDLPPAGPNNNQGNCAPPPSLPPQGVSAYPPPPVEDLPHAGTNTNQVDCVPHAALPQQGVGDYPPAPPAKDLPPAGLSNKGDCVPRPSIPLQGVSAYFPPPVEDLPHAGTNNRQVDCVPHAALPPQGARVYPSPLPAKDLPPAGPNNNRVDWVSRPLPPQGARVYPPPPPPAKDLPPAGLNQGGCFPHGFLPPQGARVYPPPPLAKDIPQQVPIVDQVPPCFPATFPFISVKPDNMV